jgi:hypothetical protein
MTTWSSLFVRVAQANPQGFDKVSTNRAGHMRIKRIRYPIAFWRDPFQPLANSLSNFLIWIRCFGLKGSDG